MRTINFGIVGTGKMSDKFIEAGNKLEGFNVSAVYSRDMDVARAFSLKHNIGLYFDNIEEMASANEVDAVYIASPNSVHKEQAIIFANNKKHILCEKALATNTHEAREMIRAAKHNNVLLMETTSFGLCPSYKIIKEKIKSIGKIRRFSSAFSRYSEEYDAIKNGTILNGFRRELSNGALMNMGINCLYPAIFLFGKPDYIKCFGNRMVTGIDGEGMIYLKYEQMDGILQYSKLSNSHVPSEIQGEDGTIVINDIVKLSSIKFINNNGDEEVLFHDDTEDEIYYEINEFIRLLQGDNFESQVNTYEKSISVMEILDEARKQIGLTYLNDRL